MSPTSRRSVLAAKATTATGDGAEIVAAADATVEAVIVVRAIGTADRVKSASRRPTPAPNHQRSSQHNLKAPRRLGAFAFSIERYGVVVLRNQPMNEGASVSVTVPFVDAMVPEMRPLRWPPANAVSVAVVGFSSASK